MIAVWLVAGCLSYTAVAAVALFALWVLFVFAMALKLARDDGRLSPEGVVFCERVVKVCAIYDVLCNIFFAWIVFSECPLPREATVSGRIQRLVMGAPNDWRTKRAMWWAAVALNTFCKKDDPHIRLPNPA